MPIIKKREPTSGLDAALNNQFAQIVKQLQSSHVKELAAIRKVMMAQSAQMEKFLQFIMDQQAKGSTGTHTDMVKIQKQLDVLAQAIASAKPRTTPIMS